MIYDRKFSRLLYQSSLGDFDKVLRDAARPWPLVLGRTYLLSVQKEDGSDTLVLPDGTHHKSKLCLSPDTDLRSLSQARRSPRSFPN
jgi:hypothetical protein